MYLGSGLSCCRPGPPAFGCRRNEEDSNSVFDLVAGQRTRYVWRAAARIRGKLFCFVKPEANRNLGKDLSLWEAAPSRSNADSLILWALPQQIHNRFIHRQDTRSQVVSQSLFLDVSDYRYSINGNPGIDGSIFVDQVTVIYRDTSKMPNRNCLSCSMHHRMTSIQWPSP